MLPKGSFILGGAASGKSAWAESFMESSGLGLIYLATGHAGDGEMSAKIARHRARRDARWETLEEPLQVDTVLAQLGPDRPVLIDCATMWLSNQMMAEADLEDAQKNLIQALDRCAAPWVIVSNEVGQGIVPATSAGRAFREAQGRLNIALAAQADLAVQVIAGLPQVLKGTLP